ncbi:hypothetical protein [Sulfurovum sp.]|uniref:hypothetical protein n=1 Tax=Sulfurovum sp. TaxID=1969726 RepID=UPI0025F4BA30|nr:hypothetical protein [Sulfurovum sp.]
MALLNLFHSLKQQLAFIVSIVFFIESANAGSLAIFNLLDLPKQKNSVYVNTQTLLANDAFSLKGLFDDFHGHFSSQNSDYKAIGDIRYDIGTYVKDSFYIGYAYRKEATIKTSPDTMKLINQVSNELDLPIGKHYRVALEIEGFETHGMVLAKTVPLYQSDHWNIKLGLGTEFLYGMQTQHGTASGEAEAVSRTDYDFFWQSNYLYTENYLYDLDVNKVTSFGYTTHIALNVACDNISIDFIANDVMGKLYWKNLPYSNVDLSSANKSYDENGYVIYAPVISGFEGNTKFTQTLMKKWRIKGKYSLGNDSFQIGTDYIDDTYLPYIQYTHLYENNILSTVSYETYFHMVGVDVKYKNYYVGIQSNGILEPSAMKIDFGLQYQF